jgi:hypothetical protein
LYGEGGAVGLLGFKRQFAPFVEEGSKTHTVRALRKPNKLGHAQRSPRVGEMVHCYVDPRQKTMRLLGRWRITKVERITITEFFNPMIPLAMSIEGQLLSTDETEAFLWRDGFRDKGGETYEAIHQAAEFWKGRLASGKPFHGQVIHWKYESLAKCPK